MWDSGKTQNGFSLNVVYNGTSLQPSTRYSWTVTVWNQRGEQMSETSWFETGLMSCDSTYQGEDAKWIGGSDQDMVLYSHYLRFSDWNIQFN